jgi:hypothetical protein
VIILPPGSRDAPAMHYKFCIIDHNTVVTGTYNWRHMTRSNDENITDFTDLTDFTGKYLHTFDSLLVQTRHSVNSLPITPPLTKAVCLDVRYRTYKLM